LGLHVAEQGPVRVVLALHRDDGRVLAAERGDEKQSWDGEAHGADCSPPAGAGHSGALERLFQGGQRAGGQGRISPGFASGKAREGPSRPVPSTLEAAEPAGFQGKTRTALDREQMPA
jgi:hypothetical protein